MHVSSVNTGRVRLVGIDGRKVLTAIDKRGVEGRVEVRPLGLDGDEQADPAVHGGLSKAVYAYPSEHYVFWQRVRAQAGLGPPAPPPGGGTERPAADALPPARDSALARWDGALAPLPPGAIGENLTLCGLLENQVWVGDLLRFPHCTLAVSEPRMPCFKFNAAMGFNQAAKLMAQSGWCGFYLAVRVPGSVQAGEAFELIAGPREVGIGELFRSRAAPARR